MIRQFFQSNERQTTVPNYSYFCNIPQKSFFTLSIMGIFDYFKKKEPLVLQNESLIWIEAADNPWNRRIVDLRPLTQGILSASENPQMASNSMSYGQDPGTSFWDVLPKKSKSIESKISFPIDKTLYPGVFFAPRQMEQKWAIFFDGTNIIFVRSWLREVFVVAKTRQENNRIFIETITGEFTEDESPELTQAILHFLLTSHVIGEVVPAPLLTELESTPPQLLQSWAFSLYGNIALLGIFDESFIAPATEPLRNCSLLHIAAAQGNIEAIEKLVHSQKDFNYWGRDGLTPFHWAIYAETTAALEKFLQLGIDPNIRTKAGATAIMQAVEANEKENLLLLLKSGADVNAQDDRGFTALHRACEMGHLELVKILLEHGAEKNVSAAEGHTPAKLAELREHQEILALLHS